MQSDDKTDKSSWQDEPVDIDSLCAGLARLGITVSKPTLYRWAQDGLIPTTKLGRYRSTVRAVVRAMTPDFDSFAKKAGAI